MHVSHPESWTRVSYGDLFEEVHEVVGPRTDVPVLSVTKNHGLMLASERFGKRIHSRDTPRYRLAPRDHIVADPMLLWSGTIGVQSVVNLGAVSPDYRVYRVREGVSVDYAAMLVRSPAMIAHYARGARGTNVRRNRITRGDFLATPVVLPPLPEQRKIAAILSSVDEAIEKTQAIIDQVQVVKKGLMQELLTRGLPGRHTKFKQTEIGEIPEEWELSSLAAAADVFDCKHRTPTYFDSGFAVVRPRDVKEGPLALTNCARTSEAEYHDLVESHRPGRNDVVYSRNASFGVASIVETDEPFAIGQDVCLIRGNRLSGRFLYYLLNAPIIRQQLDTLTSGSTFKRINLKSIRQFVVPLPDDDEQASIVAGLDSISRREFVGFEERRALESVKSALMSVLLTGEVRVKVDPEATA